MKLLLDTHRFLWLNSQPDKISSLALEACQNRENALYLSFVSLWEIQIKQQLGKLDLEIPWREMLNVQQADNGLQLLPIALAHIDQLACLLMHHRDPFDRLLIAQAQIEGMTLISADVAMASYDVRVVW